MHLCNYWPEWGIRLLDNVRGERWKDIQLSLVHEAMPFYKLWVEIEKTFTSGDGYLDKLCMELIGLPSSRCRPPTRDVRERLSRALPADDARDRRPRRPPGLTGAIPATHDHGGGRASAGLCRPASLLRACPRRGHGGRNDPGRLQPGAAAARDPASARGPRLRERAHPLADGGRSWSAPVVVPDYGWSGAECAGLTVTARGPGSSQSVPLPLVPAAARTPSRRKRAGHDAAAN